jgi:hypothetical protein
VDPAEVFFFDLHGWLLVPGLMSPAWLAEARAAIQAG